MELDSRQGPEENTRLQEGIDALRKGVQRNENLMEELLKLRQQDKQVLDEMKSMHREDAELRFQNTHLRRKLLQHPEHDEEAVEDIAEDDSVPRGWIFRYFFSSKAFWVVISGIGSIMVCCICFWVLEFNYLHHFDVDGDGEVDVEEVLIKMQQFMTVSYTTVRATGACLVVGIIVFVMLWWAGIIQAMITQLLVYAFLAVGLASCLVIFVYHVYLNITSMLGSLFKELKDMIQGVVNFLEEKAEAAAEELEKLTGSLGFLAQDSAGMYVIKSRCDLQKTEKLDSQILQMLEEGTLINILKVKTRLADKRIRGLVEAPRGWVSIQDLETGFRWSEKKEYRRGYFKVTAESIPVTSDVEVNSPPSYKPFVKKGDLLRVREVRHRLREGAVRGNIADGWITLLDTRTGKHNVETWSARVQQGIIPSFASLAGSAAVGSSSESGPEDASEGDGNMRNVQTDPFLTQAHAASRPRASSGAGAVGADAVSGAAVARAEG